jgi:hypothetical protein
MSVAFHPGQTLTVNDLKIVIRDTIGNMVDPYYIRYSLFDFTTGVEVLIGAPDRIPATVGVGQYYVDATVPLDANIGDWIVRWNFKEQVGSPMVQVVQDFNVVKENVTLCITSDDHEAVLIRRLRILLRDNNPDRNYSVAGTEEVEVDAGGKKYIMLIENLWGIIEEGKNGNL